MAVVVTGWTSPARGVEIDGFTEPYRDVDIAASEMGRIVALEVSEGDRVTVGQILARLDDDVLIASREIAKASMEAAGRLEGAKAELRMLQVTLTQLQELLARNHATQREVDRAQTQVEMAEARLKAAQEELQVKTLDDQRSQTQLDQRRVVSSINGLVTQRYKDEGEFVSPTDPIVMRVVQLDQLLIVFSVPVAEAGKLTAKGTVRVRVDAVAQPIEGVVEFVSPTADAQSGTMPRAGANPQPERSHPQRSHLPPAAGRWHAGAGPGNEPGRQPQARKPGCIGKAGDLKAGHDRPNLSPNLSP